MNYKQAGVDIKAGDRASKIAYKYACSTFSSRKGRVGEPVVSQDSFAGLIDMGEFYLVQCDDGVGTKIQIAEKIAKFDTLGYDLLAMVADDAVCLGAETISISNTLDTCRVDPDIIGELLKGLSLACIQQKVIIPGGEIAELGNSLQGNIWNATAVGILEKNKVISGKNIKPGDKIITLKEKGFRSNGFSLVRYILEKKYGKKVYARTSILNKSWGELLLEPSTIYSAGLLNVLGRYGEKRKVEIKGIAHITGGGIPGNIKRILKNNRLGAELDNIFPPSDMIIEIQKMGKVSEAEAYRTWNMGNGMMLVVAPEDVERTLELLRLTAKVAGEIIDNERIIIQTHGAQPQRIVF